MPNDRDEPIVVSADVEHGTGRHMVRTPEGPAQIGEIDEAGALGDGMPVAHPLLRLRVLLPELAQRLEGDDVRGETISF
jgi:hypothetical protein